jgi:hypothetical protein
MSIWLFSLQNTRIHFSTNISLYDSTLTLWENVLSLMFIALRVFSHGAWSYQSRS